MYYSWFLSHVVNRFSDGLPVAQFYGRAFGYPTKNLKFTLTIPYLNAEPVTLRAIKGLKISVIETRKQLLHERDLKDWCFPIRRQFLSVINIEEYTVYDSSTTKSESDWMLKLLLSRFERRRYISRGGTKMRTFQKASSAGIKDGKGKWLR